MPFWTVRNIAAGLFTCFLCGCFFISLEPTKKGGIVTYKYIFLCPCQYFSVVWFILAILLNEKWYVNFTCISTMKSGEEQVCIIYDCLPI